MWNWQGGGNGGGYTVEEVTSITPTPGWTVQRVTSRIDSVTGSAVDNSDPRNPVIDSPESLNFLSGFNSQAVTSLPLTSRTRDVLSIWTSLS